MLGFIHLWQDDYPRAISYFQDTLSQAKLYRYKHHMAISLAQLSYIYSGTDRIDLAQKLAKQALAVARKTDNAFFQLHH
ncbi:tetratricopeptide repeat protein [Merismopedia glauca]|nr:tetratricopeptide repeat protein [Merismopedia glauca]